MLTIRGKSVFLFGYYGRGNIGDDIMLNNLLNIFLDKGVSNISLLVGPDYLPSVADRRITISRGIKDNPVGFVKGLVGSDYFIWGGGTCFFDNPSERGLKELNGLLKLRGFFGKRENYFIGIGIEPIYKSREIILRILKRVKGITLRDPLSLENLIAIDDKIASGLKFLEVYDDIVFLKQTTRFLEKSGKASSNLPPGNYITFSGHFKYGREMAQHTATQIIRLLERFGDDYNIVFLPAKFKSESDDLFHDLVINELREARFGRFFKADINDINDFVSVLGHAKYHIGMRLHSLILADMLNIPNIALAYQNKVFQYAPYALEPGADWAGGEFKHPENQKKEWRIDSNTVNYEKFFC